jgi:hypothetical protein
MKKEYILIYFNEDGGVNISQESRQEIEDHLKEVLECSGNALDYYVTSLDKEVDSMYRKEDQRYMIIKGELVIPKIVQTVTKLEI